MKYKPYNEVTKEEIVIRFLHYMESYPIIDRRHCLLDNSGQILFDHACMSSGETLTELFEAMGIGYDNGYSCVLNERGIALLNTEIGDITIIE